MLAETGRKIHNLLFVEAKVLIFMAITGIILEDICRKLHEEVEWG